MALAWASPLSCHPALQSRPLLLLLLLFWLQWDQALLDWMLPLLLLLLAGMAPSTWPLQ